MFEPGDIVKIKKDYLDKGEDPTTEYAVIEDYGDGKVKVACHWNGFMGYLLYTWPDYTMEKVGHVDLDKLTNK